MIEDPNVKIKDLIKKEDEQMKIKAKNRNTSIAKSMDGWESLKSI